MLVRGSIVPADGVHDPLHVLRVRVAEHACQHKGEARLTDPVITRDAPSPTLRSIPSTVKYPMQCVCHGGRNDVTFQSLGVQKVLLQLDGPQEPAWRGEKLGYSGVGLFNHS